MKSLQFKLSKRTVPVVIEDESGNQTQWELREVRAADRDKYLNKVASLTRYDEQGRAAGMKSFDGLSSCLLCMSMFRTDGPDAGKAVTEKQVNDWPSTCVAELFDAARVLNGIKDAKEGEEKDKETEPKN